MIGRLLRRRREALARARALAFYGTLVRPGELVFDVGANVGDRVDLFLGLGARVVAVEPQAACAARIRERFGSHGDLVVEQTAVGAEDGELELHVGSESTLATAAPQWIEATTASGRFAGHTWDRVEKVPVTTLDALVARHGVPALCKIDVEGFEQTVLEGLSGPLGVVSLEFAMELIERTEACVRRLAALGATGFSYSLGESMALADDWVGAEELLARLRALPDPLAWGDVYARFPAGA